MITDKDIEKMKAVFATKADLISFVTKNDLKRFATKEDLKQYATKDALQALDEKMGKGFVEIIKYIGDTRDDIVHLLSKQINDFKQEMRDITRSHQSTLDNHETRLAHLEYIKP